jgi:FtsP/CotA-like multicopper oxidase with cupredoxin domain
MHHRTRRRYLTITAALAMVAAMIGQVGITASAQTTPDPSKHPHYFGPWPNWANSPFTLPDVQVEITGTNTAPAAATATVGANGGISAITVTDPGNGYKPNGSGSVGVSITGAGTGATAKATVTKTGAVTAIAVTTPGAGYTTPVVTISSTSGTGATAHALGGVDALAITNLGSVDGYHLPTVSFDMPADPNGMIAEGRVLCDTMVDGQCANPNPDGSLGVVHITGIEVTNPGSGYSAAPGVAIIDGTQFEPAPSQPGDPALVAAEVKATISVEQVVLDTFGQGYTTATVSITDADGTPTTLAQATATVDTGAVTAITVTKPGSGYITPGGIKKFTDTLPGLCNPGSAAGGIPACPASGKFIPLAVPDTSSYPGADTYEIGLVQYRTNFSSSMPQGALVRGYVQIDTGVPGGQHVELFNELKDGTKVSTGYFGVTAPQYMGPSIVTARDHPVRIVFRNLLPTGNKGDLFIPTDTTMMGSGTGPGSGDWATAPADQGTVFDGVRNPACTDGFNADPKECYTQNRATVHLHGGITPWISDGTPHQWITPASEATDYPQGVSVENVPDMAAEDCDGTSDGCMTLYYTNQQSARLMFYHDHAWGITRLNVYAGEAAPYLVTDDTEQALINGGALDGLGYGTPLVIQDKTFVPSQKQMYGAPNDPVWGEYGQDPTWDASRWGGPGSLWYHHVYMPAQNPGDPSGMSAFGRWMYGPWFWPPADPTHPPIKNPYFDASCDLNDPGTWTYQEDPFCEPQYIPSTPNVSAGMEQFNDTPIVNGTAYPTMTVDAKAYRFRILNAANDRFWNLQWYVADATGTEVALKANEIAAAQADPNVFPTPDTTLSPQGPNFVQIGNEGGFLPSPVVVPNQPITWITDPTRFDVGNVDKHALLLAPAERADVVVDFSQFRGKTLILYNDAPAAFPARVASYDYYTGAPDLRPVGAPSILPGYGPNTRTIMQIKVTNSNQKSSFTVSKLNAAFSHKANGTGVFESGQDPIIVGQAAYNRAYGTDFVSAGWCNSPDATGLAATRCDGFARINEGSQKPGEINFGFNSLRNKFRPGNGKVEIPFQPKGMHDEMNATAFDEFGRMQANLGLEAPGANPLLQNIILYPYVNPSTEVIDATGLPTADMKVTPIAQADDGTQIWKITHNGVDTHPIHWHLWNVQVINRVTWDNIIIPPDPDELGWKETVRISPLEDTIVALRPIIPTMPFEVPNSVRPLNPMAPAGFDMGFNNVDQFGNPTSPITNDLTNLGWEYVYHCHILSHEEMDMMRPVMVMLPPIAASDLAWDATTPTQLNWTDNSINETQFVVQVSTDGGATWSAVDTLLQDLHQSLPSGHGTRSLDLGALTSGASYRVVAQNVVGYLGANGAFMNQTVRSVSAEIVAP